MKARRFALLLVLLPACNPCAFGEGSHWPQFRGPAGNGIAETGTIPVSWSADKNVSWKTDLPGNGWSQPIIWEDSLFVTFAESPNQKRPQGGPFIPSSVFGSVPEGQTRWGIARIDKNSGRILWTQIAHEGRPAIPIQKNNTYASETPVTDGKVVVAYFGAAGLFAYDFSGKQIWKKEPGVFSTQFGWGTGSSPALHNGTLFIQCDNEQSSFVAAYELSSGREVWKAARTEKSNWATPYLWQNKLRTELVTAGGARMRSYDPATGKLLWEMAGSGRTSITPVGDAELLYLDSCDRLQGISGRLVAVRPGGSGDISLKPGEATNDFVAWSVPLNGNRLASPLLHHGSLYFLREYSGTLTCYDAGSGKIRYQERIPGSPGFTASPIAAGSHLYCLDENGLVSVLESGPKFALVSQNKIDGLFWASPAISGEHIYLRSLESLFCIGK